MHFENFDLDPNILRSLKEAGFEAPTPIQIKAIPEMMKGFDLRASAQTGTGKTMAFLLPALQRLSFPSPVKGIGPRILILAPTRELALQIAQEAEKHSRYLPKVKTVCIFGGAPYPIQKRQLARPFEILVATPGRLIDHMNEGRINFSRLEMLVLDEADRMLDMGFIKPVEHIASEIPAARQTVLFSATLKGPVMKLSEKLMRNPKEVCVIPPHEKHENIEQFVFYADHLQHKLNLLKNLLQDSSINQAVIFTATKRAADEVCQALRDMGHLASALHGDMDQRQRTRTLDHLRKGNLRFLVATDVAARGLDVATISHVFNFDLPHSGEDYTHRIGRTGRAGAQGIAYAFASPKDRILLKQIEEFTKQKIAVRTVEGLEPSFNFEVKKKSSSPLAKTKKPFFRKEKNYKRPSKPNSGAPASR